MLVGATGGPSIWAPSQPSTPRSRQMPAWNLLPAGARDTYRRWLGVDDATWERGRGWAIVQAIVALPYYQHTNPAMAGTARHTLAAVLG